MTKKLTRRDFARASAGAAVMALPAGLVGKGTAPSKPSASEKGAALARDRRVTMPAEVANVSYGGMGIDGRNLLLAQTLSPPGQAPTYPGAWREGTTIPGEYYVEEKHYLNDERFLKEHFWFMVDHESRIPKPGDYFLFQFGLGDSVIIVRDQAGAVKAYHNVCRHRGSRLCQHDEVVPTEAGPGARRPDAKFSVVQLASEGNTRVFRCPYHAWTYDLSGKLVYVPPNGTPSGFDQTLHGLHPAHVRTMEGFIWVSLALQEPPDFDTWVGRGVRQTCQDCGTARLKIAARRSAPTKANWKLVIENFRECYHCQAGHTNSFITAHWRGDETLSAAQIARIEQDIRSHGHDPGDFFLNLRQRADLRDRLVGDGLGMGMGGGTPNRLHFRPGYVTASLDGKPVAPLLPGVKEYSHYPGSYGGRGTASGFSTTSISVYDDYVFCLRFTPRSVMLTDAEAFWLVHPDAKEGKDYDVEHLIGLWYNTYREDRWLAENNHIGILSSRYALNGGQPYMATEGGPAGFVKWYMREVARASATKTDSV